MPRLTSVHRPRRQTRTRTRRNLGRRGHKFVSSPRHPLTERRNTRCSRRPESREAARGFRTAIGALHVPRVALSLGPGEVRENLAAGLARLCYAPLRTPRFRLDACSGAFIGLIGAEGVGFSRNDERSRLWFAVPVGVEGTLWTGSVGWGLGASALFPLHRSDFGIDGLGAAYRSPWQGASQEHL